MLSVRWSQQRCRSGGDEKLLFHLHSWQTRWQVDQTPSRSVRPDFCRNQSGICSHTRDLIPRYVRRPVETLKDLGLLGHTHVPQTLRSLPRILSGLRGEELRSESKTSLNISQVLSACETKLFLVEPIKGIHDCRHSWTLTSTNYLPYEHVMYDAYVLRPAGWVHGSGNHVSRVVRRVPQPVLHFSQERQDREAHLSAVSRALKGRLRRLRRFDAVAAVIPDYRVSGRTASSNPRG
jgi:hypothetical protein